MPALPVFTTVQLIVGSDFHRAIPPPTPLMVPHVVVWGSGASQKTAFMWAIAATSRASSPESGCLSPTVVGYGHACGRTHDAGPHPGHLWPNALLPVILLGSSSKAEFGSGSVKVGVSPQGGGSADLAINVAHFLNTNLDCQDFPLTPMPTGLCFTTHYSVRAGFTFTDFLRGLIQMVADMIVTWLVGGACAKLTGVLTGVMGRIFGRSALNEGARPLRSASDLMNDGAGYFASNGRLFVDGWRFVLPAAATAWREAPTNQVIGLVGTAVGTFGAGTPVGFSPENAPVGGWNPDNHTGAGKLNKVIDKLYR